ncbi:MAG: ribosome-binding factor A [Gammaproteobacteria bacterium]|jgi:ribosome-binding factor A|nr:ribosome-binding factor A [Gammaproteobacteria bacterium]MEC7368934.1 30S ribosome-binding factor RbfA [Pseudomonadota bacterium]
MKANFNRTDRVADHIQKNLAVLVQRELKDPRLGMVTINEAKVSRDLAFADVYFTVFPDSKDKQTELLLNNSASYLRKQLASMLNTRITPKLRFHYDKSLVDGARISAAIKAASSKGLTEAADDEI